MRATPIYLMASFIVLSLSRSHRTASRAARGTTGSGTRARGAARSPQRQVQRRHQQRAEHSEIMGNARSQPDAVIALEQGFDNATLDFTTAASAALAQHQLTQNALATRPRAGRPGVSHHLVLVGVRMRRWCQGIEVDGSGALPGARG